MTLDLRTIWMWRTNKREQVLLHWMYTGYSDNDSRYNDHAVWHLAVQFSLYVEYDECRITNVAGFLCCCWCKPILLLMIVIMRWLSCGSHHLVDDVFDDPASFCCRYLWWASEQTDSLVWTFTTSTCKRTRLEHQRHHQPDAEIPSWCAAFRPDGGPAREPTEVTATRDKVDQIVGSDDLMAFEPLQAWLLAEWCLQHERGWAAVSYHPQQHSCNRQDLHNKTVSARAKPCVCHQQWHTQTLQDLAHLQKVLEHACLTSKLHAAHDWSQLHLF